MHHQVASKHYGSHLDVLDHLDLKLGQNNEVVASNYYKNISSTSSDFHQSHQTHEQQFRVIKDGRHLYDDGFNYQVTSTISEAVPERPHTKVLTAAVCNEATSSIPDLGECYALLTHKNIQTKSIFSHPMPFSGNIFPAFSFLNSLKHISLPQFSLQWQERKRLGKSSLTLRLTSPICVRLSLFMFVFHSGWLSVWWRSGKSV